MAGGLRYETGRDMPPGMLEKAAVKIARSMTQATPVPEPESMPAAPATEPKQPLRLIWDIELEGKVCAGCKKEFPYKSCEPFQCSIREAIAECKTVEAVPISEIYRVIAGHGNYHGDNILSALTCIAEGKEVKSVRPLAPGDAVEVVHGRWYDPESDDGGLHQMRPAWGQCNTAETEAQHEDLRGISEKGVTAMAKIICIAGYKAFTGNMRVFWKDKPTEEIYGDWLYRPDTNRWYCKDADYPADLCMIVR